jgi:hypothetical protein
MYPPSFTFVGTMDPVRWALLIALVLVSCAAPGTRMRTTADGTVEHCGAENQPCCGGWPPCDKGLECTEWDPCVALGSRCSPLPAAKQPDPVEHNASARY